MSFKVLLQLDFNSYLYFMNMRKVYLKLSSPLIKVLCQGSFISLLNIIGYYEQPTASL